MYYGYITTIKKNRKHSNADRLQCVEVFGQNVIVDMNYREGQKIIFFPCDGQLSEEYAKENNLLRMKDENGNNIGGYMDANKRNIVAIKLRGEKSEGLILPIESLSKYTDITQLKNGDKINILNGVEICKKYIPVNKTYKCNIAYQKVKKKNNVDYPFFEQHKDTAQLAYNRNAFQVGDIIYITRKLHGTSGRTMNTTKVYKKTNKLREFFQLSPKIKKESAVITGTRRVILDDINSTDGYYSDNNFRKKWHELLKDRLPEGMKTFYETIPKTRLMRRVPVAIRIDGKAFHSFTKGFERPLMRC